MKYFTFISKIISLKSISFTKEGFIRGYRNLFLLISILFLFFPLLGLAEGIGLYPQYGLLAIVLICFLIRLLFYCWPELIVSLSLIILALLLFSGNIDLYVKFSRELRSTSLTIYPQNEKKGIKDQFYTLLPQNFENVSQLANAAFTNKILIPKIYKRFGQAFADINALKFCQEHLIVIPEKQSYKRLENVLKNFSISGHLVVNEIEFFVSYLSILKQSHKELTFFLVKRDNGLSLYLKVEKENLEKYLVASNYLFPTGKNLRLNYFKYPSGKTFIELFYDRPPLEISNGPIRSYTFFNMNG